MRLGSVVFGLSLAVLASSVVVGVRADPVSLAHPQATEPDGPHGTWRRVVSNNFVAVGNASEAALRDAVTELEVFRSAMFSLSSELPRPRLSSTTPLMVLFSNNSVFGPYKPRDNNGDRRNNVGGYYLRTPLGAFMLTSADGHRLGYQLSTVLHEYAHDVFRHTLGNRMPTWLSEGLAEFAGSTGAAGDSQVTGRYLGRPLDWHVARVRAAERPRVADLLGVDGSALQEMNANDIGLFYAKSWALVHYLMLGRDDRRPGDVPAYIAALETNEGAVEAFQRAFRVDMATIDATLARYMARVAFPAIRIEDATAAFRTITAGPMLKSEVEQLQGQLMLQIGDMPGAETRLLRALAMNPTSAAARVSLAEHRLADVRPLDAIEIVAPTATVGGGDAVSLITLGRAQQQAGRHREALDTFTAATALKMTDVAEAAAWYGRSLAALSLGLTDEGSEAMTRVQSLSKSDGWYSQRSRDLWAAGRDTLAVADAETVLAGLGDETTNRSYTSFTGALSARRMNQAATASDLLARGTSPGDAPWTRTVRSYLLGNLSDRDFLARASGRGEQTEAHAYIGLTASIAGRLDDARQHLVWVRDRGSRAYFEHHLALVELARIEGR